MPRPRAIERQARPTARPGPTARIGRLAVRVALEEQAVCRKHAALLGAVASIDARPEPLAGSWTLHGSRLTNTSGEGFTLVEHAAVCEARRTDTLGMCFVRELRACAALCAARTQCSFFSHSARFAICVLGAACALRLNGSWAPERFVPARFWPASWPGERADAPPTSAFSAWRRGAGRMVAWSQAETVAALAPHLRGEYSTAVYGAPGRVDLGSLRLLWLALLPPPAVRALRRIGVCRFSSRPPLRPFFAPVSFQINPTDAVWVHATAAAVPDHGWAEVTHCPDLLRADATADGRPPSNSMWLYVAPGSGVWLNVGRTRVVASREEAIALLRAAHAAAAPGDGGAANLSRHGRTACEQLRARGAGQAAVAGARGAGLAGYDSVQVVANTEFFSHEARHELILLARDNCAPLDAATPGLRCGRAPQLGRCTAAALARLASCSAWQAPFSAALAPRVPLLATNPRHRHHECASNKCLARGGRYECPRHLVQPLRASA